MCDSTLHNVDEWRRKLGMLLRSNDEFEIISKERKDRRDFKELSQLAISMGLHRYISVVNKVELALKYCVF